MHKQRFLVQFGTTAIAQLVGMLAGIVVARLAGPSVVGILAYATSYVGLFGFVNSIFSSPHIKLASEGRDHGECMAVITRISIGTGVVYLVLVLGWFLTQKYIMHYPFESRDVQIVILLTLLANLIHKYEGYATTVFTANLKQAKANIPTFFRTLAYHGGRVLIVVLGYRAVALSMWNLVTIILTVPLIYRLMREYPIGKYNPRLAREYFVFSFPLMIDAVVTSVTGFADKLVLAHYTNTTQLGYFSAARAIGGMFMLIALPVGSIFFPLFSGLIARGNWDGVNANIRKYQEFIALFVFPLICALIVAGGPALLLMLGQRYQPSILPFMILLVSTYIVLWGLPYGNILSAMGKFNLAALINVIKLAVFLVSITAFLSPKFLNLGVTGVAANLVVLNLTGNSLYIFFAKKHGEVYVNARNHLRHLVIFLITAGGYFVAEYLRARFYLWWLAYIPAFLLITYSVLIVTKLINREHWLLLIDAFNFKKTMVYVNNEIRGGTGE